MLLAICTKQVTKRAKKKKKKLTRSRKICFYGKSNPDPPNTFGLKMNTSIQ